MKKHKFPKYQIQNSDTLFNLSYVSDYAILTGGMGIQALIYGLSGGNLTPTRSTSDLDLVVLSENKEHLLDSVSRNPYVVRYKKKETSIINGYIIETKKGPYYSVSFKDDIPEYITVKIKGLRLKVEAPEYMLVNKVRTWLRRKERKDIIDIYDILKLVASGYYQLDKSRLDRALDYYGLEENMFWRTIKSMLSVIY